MFTAIFVVCVFILTNSVQAFTNSDYYANQNISIGLESMLSNQLNITLNGDYILNGVLRKSGTSYILKVSGAQIDLNGTLYNNVTFIPQNNSNTMKIVSSYSRNYLGTLTFKIDSSTGTSKVLPINTLNIEEYLKGVVGKEMSDYYPIEALKAQAVAARNYAIASMGKHIAKGYNLCDTTDCQVYGGYDASYKNVIAAVEATKGMVLLSGTNIVQALYSASDGGYTEASSNVWGGTYPYLIEKKDDFDKEMWPAGVKFSKSWNAVSDAKNSGGTAQVSYVNGAFINFSFSGSSVKIIGLMDKYRGKAEIRIDGILVKTIDSYSATEQYMTVLFEAKGLSTTGVHQLNIKATGDKNVSSLGNTIYLDAIETVNAFGETIRYEDKDTYHLKFTAKIIEDTLRKSGKIPLNYSFVKIDINSITKYTSGRIKNITLNLKDDKGNPIAKSFSANQARTFLSLPSAMYDVIYDSNLGIYTFYGKGYGHGLGMSQIGAQNRALAGQSFETILKFYYEGTTLVDALPSYTVTFNSQGGSAVIGKNVDYNSSITAPATPTKAGYIFGGWYKEAGTINAWNFTTDIVTANTTLYAKWIVAIPKAPSGVTAVSTIYNSVLLKWTANPVDGTNGYEVYRATSSTGDYTLLSTTTATSYKDNGLTTGSTYYYKVRAYRGSTDKVYSGFSTIVSLNVINVERLAGINRIETSISIAKNQYTDKAPDAVVLATGNNFADALAGSGLAYKYNAPLLLVNKTVSDSKTVLNYITANLNENKNIYILGSTGVVSKEISDYLTMQGYNIIRLGGKDRYETNQKIVNYLNTPKGTSVVITTGVNFADALGISSIADIKGYPILLNGKDNLSASVSNNIANIQPTTVYIIGGTGVISTNIETQIKKLNANITIVRLGGENRYETSIKIIEHFNLTTTTITVATGINFPDSLSGSVLAARMNSGVLLIDNNDITKQKALINKQNITKVIVLGGEGVISNDVATSLIQK